MAYYGDPETLRKINKNIAEVLNDDFDGQVAAWDSIAKIDIESDLLQVFSSWPAADSTNLNAISNLWLMKMSYLMQNSEFAANTVIAVSPFGANILEAYDKMFARIREGTLMIAGAQRANSTPSISKGGIQNWKLEDEYVDPKTPSSKFPHGLRR